MAVAESLLSSLCRESCWLRTRLGRLSADLRGTQHPALAGRLRRERETLLARRRELQRLCQQLRALGAADASPALALLQELTCRPIVCS
ncbi:MAG: hypothetical protein FJ078_02780 [Cyanobacteria bacterium K_DeepCast_35m_m2_155]|nr:hypothetical protein [Cyanobacteria bacterium K_DeepCast_35m_m2_155]